MYVKNMHWHSLYAIELGSSAFSSAVNIWNLVGIPFGEVRRKTACQRDESPFFFSFKKMFKKRNLKETEVLI